MTIADIKIQLCSSKVLSIECGPELDNATIPGKSETLKL